MVPHTSAYNDRNSQPSTSNTELGFRLRRLREAFGLSQRDLAKRAGVTNSNISMIEQGQISPSVQSLQKIIDVFPLSLSEFFSSNFLQNQSPFIPASSISVELLAHGIEQRCLKLSEFSYLYRQSIPTATDSASYTFPADVTLWLISGQLTLELNGNHYSLSKGDAFRVKEGQTCCIANHQIDSADLFLVFSYTQNP